MLRTWQGTPLHPSETAAARSRTARGGACMRGQSPLKLPLGWHMAHGTQWGESCRSKDSPHPIPEVFFAVTQARKGSMSRCAHRPSTKSDVVLARRVNSAIGERVGLDLLRRPRRPVVTDSSIDTSTVSLHRELCCVVNQSPWRRKSCGCMRNRACRGRRGLPTQR